MEVIVEFDYNAVEPDELTIRKGEILREVSQFEEGWFIGSLNGRVGVFPDNFVKLIRDIAGDTKSVSPLTHGTRESMKNQTHTIEPIEMQSGLITGHPVTGIGLGDIFSNQPIRLKQAAIKDVIREKDAAEKPRTTTGRPPSPTLVDRVRVRHEYTPKQSDELELQVDDVIQVLDRNLPDDGWWRGKNLRNRKIGVFPDNFVVPITDTPVQENDTSHTRFNSTDTVHMKGHPNQMENSSNTHHSNSAHAHKSTPTQKTDNSSNNITSSVTIEPAKIVDKTSHNSHGPRLYTDVHRTTPVRAQNGVPQSNSPTIPDSAEDSRWQNKTHPQSENERLRANVESAPIGDTPHSNNTTSRLVGLTADRPKQTGRRLPTKLLGASSQPSVSPIEDPSRLKTTANPRVQVNHARTRGTPTVPTEDVSEHSRSVAGPRTSDPTNKSCRNATSNQQRTSPLTRSEGVNVSSDVAKPAEPKYTNRWSQDKSKEQYEQLRLDYDNFVLTYKQQFTDMCNQMASLTQFNSQLKSDLQHTQKQLTHRTQSLMHELDEVKKHQAADSVELARLRKLLLQLDAENIAAADKTFQNPADSRSDPNNKGVGDAIHSGDDRYITTEDEILQSGFDEEEIPMVGDNLDQFEASHVRNDSKMSGQTVSSTTPHFRPRPAHISSSPRE